MRKLGISDAIIAAIIGGIFVVIAAFIQREQGNNPGTPSPPSPQVTSVATDPPTATPTLTPTLRPLPTPQLVENLRINSSNEAGTVYRVPLTGWYRFDYDRGAYAAVDSPFSLSCDPPCFSGNLIALLDRQPTFTREGEVNTTGALFQWYTEGDPESFDNENPHLWGSAAEVEAEFAGRRAGALLSEGQQVYFIVGDCQGCFLDNTGSIYINIFYRP